MTRPPCPICDAPQSKREQLAGGNELCNRCGYAIQLNEKGELVGWSTTNKSHPRGIFARVAALLLVASIVGGCVVRPPAPAPVTTPRPRPQLPQVIILDDAAPETLRICVTVRPIQTFAHPYVCVTLRDLRLQLRGRRLASLPQ
jgi:hypothetical protein